MSTLPSTTFSDAPPAPEVKAPPTPPDIDVSVDQVAPRRGRQGRDLTDGSAEYQLVPIGDLHPDPDQPRKTFRNVSVLAANIKQVGLAQPVTARIAADGTLTIMYGERRWRAMQELNWTHVPTLIRYGVKDSQVLAAQLSENSREMRQDLDPIDEARGIRAFMRINKLATYLQAAEALGHSLTWVSNRIALLDLEPEDQEAVREKRLSLLDGVAKARQKTGNTRFSAKRAAANGSGYPTTPSPVTVRREAPHFSDEHPLAGRAAARCKVHNFPKPQIGGVACGKCWEIVIRLDAGRNPLPISGRAPVDADDD